MEKHPLPVPDCFRKSLNTTIVKLLIEQNALPQTSDIAKQLQSPKENEKEIDWMYGQGKGIIFSAMTRNNGN